MDFSIAVVGATGNVGREIFRTLEDSNIKIREISAYASEKSIGKQVSFGKLKIDVNPTVNESFHDVDLVFFATEAAISGKYAKYAAKHAKLVIDLSSHFRMDKDVPLVVPEVNPESMSLALESKIIANPNCVVIPMVVALKKLNEFAEVSRIVVSTYQSVSGAGKKAMDTLYDQSKRKIFNVFEEQEVDEDESIIAFNVIPKIDELTASGYTKEEIKVANETKKILSEEIEVSSTCVRIPVFVGHSMAINVEFCKNISVEEAYSLLEKAEGVIVSKDSYFSPIDCVGKDEVFVSRIRQDIAKNILNLWVVSDNLRKGAALNAVQIAEKFIEKHL
ncbi:MAG: aspartate-semialdehyde dehydrogenase [Candidatus Midichloriaceae bacterium]|jgi:aspartate-semialdehyde dehydrogenase